MNYENLIKNAYKYYDEKSELYDHIIKGTVRYEEDTSDNDLTKRVIRFYDDKNNTKLEANYEYMGFKTDLTEGPTRKGLWIWGWAKEESSKNMTYISKNILKYGLDIVLNESVLNNKVEHKENSNKFLKSLLINSKIIYENEIELDILTYLSFYLSKKDWFIAAPPAGGGGGTDYIYLYNIKIY